MLRRFIAKNVGLPLFDHAKGLEVRRYYKFYKKMLAWGRSALENYQLQKLKNILEYAYENVPFYRVKFQEKDLSLDSITTIRDMQKIPPLTRQDLQKNINLLISET